MVSSIVLIKIFSGAKVKKSREWRNGKVKNWNIGKIEQ
jgi:hypothetical protein